MGTLLAVRRNRPPQVLRKNVGAATWTAGGSAGAGVKKLHLEVRDLLSPEAPSSCVAERGESRPDWAHFGDTPGRFGEHIGNSSGQAVEMIWLGGRDSNPDTQIQSLQSYR